MQTALVHQAPFHEHDTAARFRADIVTHIPLLHRRALRLVRSADAAFELVQDSVERALRFERHFQSGTNLVAWLHTLMYRVFVSQFRRKRRSYALDLQVAHDPCAAFLPDYGLVETPISSKLEQALAELPPLFRDVLLLVDIQEATYRESAEQLGVPIGTVMSRLFRARRLLRERLDAALPTV
jgi:RNA polymerase sigma-70 factor, ECF subfamily